MSLDNYKIYFNNDTVSLSHTSGYPNIMSTIYVDMTGWLDGKCPNDKGTYSYAFDFYDSSNTYQYVVCSGMSPNAMLYMFDTVRQRYNLAPGDTTDVHIIAPAGCIANKRVKIGCLSQCNIQTLRLHGMDALDFRPTSDNDLDVKLQSVCDAIVHNAQIGYKMPLPQSGSFEKSIYGFYRQDRQRREALCSNCRDTDFSY